MDFDRNSMTVPVQSSDYTNKSLQKDSNPTTMEVVTQTNAVKSPTDSPATTKLVYTVEEIARMLAISLRSAYNLCNSTTEFRVLRVGGSIRIPKDGFDAWLNRSSCSGGNSMAYITKRGSSYSVRYTYEDEHGKSCDKLESFPTKEEATN